VRKPHAGGAVVLSRAGVAVAVGAIFAFLLTVRVQFAGARAALILAVACVGWAAAFVGLRREPTGVPMPILVAAVASVFVLAVVLPPRQSNDVYLYASYGRIIATHHRSPFTAVPADFPRDPLYQSVANGWRHTRSLYGPAFLAYSAAAMRVLPPKRLAARLVFQFTAAVACALVCMMLWRRNRSPAVLVFVGLQPVVVLSVVNGGHNDALVALALVVAAGCAAGERLLRAAIGLAAGVLVKVTVVFGAIAFVAWLLARGQRKQAAQVAAVAIALPLVVIAAIPGALRSLSAAASDTSRASLLHTLRVFTDPASGVFAHLLHLSAGAFGGVAKVATAVAGLIAFGWTWRWVRRDATLGAASALGLGLVVYLVLGGWVMPWYPLWALVLVAPRADRFAALVGGHASVLLLLYQIPAAFVHAGPGHPAYLTLTLAAPLLVIAAYAWWWVQLRRQPSRPTGAPSTI
jgi:hypothetical protein